MPFSFRRQLEAIDCGATCLQMISAYYGKKYDLGQLREWCSVSRTGVNIKDITETSKQIGL